MNNEQQNIFGKLSFIFGTIGLVIFIFVVAPAVTIGINVLSVFFHIDSNVTSYFDPLRITIFSDFLFGIIAIKLSRLQLDKKENKMAKAGFIMGLIICVISFPFVIIGLFAG